MIQNDESPDDKVCKNDINDDRLLTQAHEGDSSRVDNGVEIGEILTQLFSAAILTWT
jgi:hypothetical protein